MDREYAVRRLSRAKGGKRHRADAEEDGGEGERPPLRLQHRLRRGMAAQGSRHPSAPPSSERQGPASGYPTVELERHPPDPNATAEGGTATWDRSINATSDPPLHTRSPSVPACPTFRDKGLR